MGIATSRRVCLYCSADANSREHVLPAGLGGRRVGTDIVCSEHNQLLGFLDKKLVDQIGQIGCSVGVRRDRSDAPHRYVSLDRRLRRVFFKDHLGGVEPAAPVVWEVTRNQERFLRIAGTQSQLDEARRIGKEIGLNADWGPRAEEGAIAFELIQRISYGGRLFRRAAAKIALHVLAWRYPDLARHEALEQIRAWITSGREDEECVWLDFSTSESHLRRPATPFVHRVVIAADGRQALLQARLTFFAELSVAVRLGRLPVTTFTHVVDFDPLAELPDDLVELRLPDVLTQVSAPRDVYTVEVFGRIDRILLRAAARTWEQTARSLVADLNAMRATIPARDRAAAIDARLVEENGRLLSLVAGVTRWARAWYPNDSSRLHVRRLKRLVSQSRTGPLTVNLRTWRIVAAVRSALASEISYRLTYRPLRSQEIRTYFEGLDGHAVAVATMAKAAGIPAPTVTRKEVMSWIGRFWRWDEVAALRAA